MWDKTKNSNISTDSFIKNCPKTVKINENKCVGPTPDMLAKYISKNIDKTASRNNYYEYDKALNAIKSDLNRGEPVIVLISTGPLSMHYINVVGVSSDDEVAILDTDKLLYWYTKEEFKEIMDMTRYPYISGRFVLIRFYEN